MKKRLTLTTMLLLAAGAWSSLFAIEPASEFLDALRARGYHDVALDYLELMKNSPLVPVDFKEAIQYQKGLTLMEASRLQGDQALRERYLNEAQQALQQFVSQHAVHAKANAARSQLGNLVVERARTKVEQSRQPNANKQQLLADAKQLYDEAFHAFAALEESVKTQLERIPQVLDLKDKRQAEMAELRNQLRADFLQTMLLAAAIREETADTVAPDSAEYKTLLTEAAGRYEEMYKKYRLRLAGLYARMYQGRANQKIGKLKDALGYYSELLDQPDEPKEFRDLKTKTLRLAMDGWLAQQQYVEAIKWASDWVRKSGPADDVDPDWLAIRLALARAYKMQADQTDGSNQEGKRTIAQSLDEARQQAQFVAAKRSEFQDEARQMVADLGGPDRTGEKPDPQNFAEALQAGRQALEALSTAELIVNQVPSRLQAETNPTEKANLQKQLDEARQTLATARNDAMNYFQLAIKLINAETSLEDVNTVRYFMCYLHYLAGDYYKAALLGDFVSRRYPDSGGARQCAKIALASYVQVYAESEDDKSFATDKITSIAQYIADTWSAQPEAEDALNTLIPFMINSGELDRAQEFLAKLPESSPKRGDAELKTGQAMWSMYLRESQKLRQLERDGNRSGVDLADERAKLNELRSQATGLLASGFGRLGAGTAPETSVVTALLSLAQAYLESQQAAQAVAVLEHGQLGPLTLANQKHAAVTDSALVTEIYKTGLRSYISSLGSGDATATIGKAKGVMTQLQAAMSGSEGADKQLMAIYVGLARDLESQLAAATPEARRVLSQGFETFLRELGTGSSELSVLNWVAESFAKLGESLDDGASLNADAQKYYQASLDAFQNVLDKGQPDEQTRLQIQIRRGSVMGQARDFEGAVGIFEEALTAKPMMINVQVEAARLLERWAKQPGQEQKYLDAITGFSKSGKSPPAIWGWGKIANTTSRFPKFMDTFHEARVHIAQCRFDLAQTKSGGEQQELLKAAERDIKLTKQLFSDLGGDKWIPQYDALLKRIQTAKGDAPRGLQALETTETAATAR